MMIPIGYVLFPVLLFCLYIGALLVLHFDYQYRLQRRLNMPVEKKKTKLKKGQIIVFAEKDANPFESN